MKSKILAIETSTQGCSVALLNNGSVQILTERDHRQQSKVLLNYIDSLLNQSNCKLSELDGIALTIGPGSFTGIRLALTTIQGLTISKPIPILPVSTLYAYARAAYTTHQATDISVCVNAYMQQVFYCHYTVDASHIFNSSQEVLISPEKLTLADNAKLGLGVGDGWQQYQMQFSSIPSQLDSTLTIDANTIIAIATQAEEAKWQPVESIQANYLRQSDAWQKH